MKNWLKAAIGNVHDALKSCVATYAKDCPKKINIFAISNYQRNISFQKKHATSLLQFRDALGGQLTVFARILSHVRLTEGVLVFRIYAHVTVTDYFSGIKRGFCTKI